MANDIRVGVIGFGLAGRIFHAAVVAETPGLELACIVQRRGDEAAKAYPGVRIARSIEEMLEDRSVHLVVVGTPSYAHFEHGMQCLRARRNVMIDKPFALTSQEAAGLIDEARKQGVLLTAYQNRRWDGNHLTLKQVLASGRLGRVVSYESHFDRFREQPRLDVWRESGGPGGGTLFDLGSHLIDQVTALFGNPRSLWADVRIDRENGAADDAFPGPQHVVHGTKGSFVKWGLDPQEDALKAGAKFSDPGFGEDSESKWGTLYIPGQAPEKIKTVPGDYRGIYVNVRDAILGKAKLEVTPEHAWRTTRLIELARLSSAEGRRVAFSS